MYVLAVWIENRTNPGACLQNSLAPTSTTILGVQRETPPDVPTRGDGLPTQSFSFAP